jgi:hypothetical protein
MSVIFADIKARLSTPKQLEPISGIIFSEIFSADDTLLSLWGPYSLFKQILERN